MIMLDIALCTNPVNYTIFLAGVHTRDPGRRILMLYDARRFRPVPLAHGWTMAQTLWRLRWLKLLSYAGLVGKVYIPHLRINRRWLTIALHARQTIFIDDGLDTRRQQPSNIFLQSSNNCTHMLPNAPLYFTFSDYAILPQWMRSFEVHRVCSLAKLAQSSLACTVQDECGNPIDNPQHIFFESPGLDVASVIQTLGLDPSNTLVIRHPVASKRGMIPAGCRELAGASVNSEVFLNGLRGRQVYFGETLLLYFSVHGIAASNNQLFAQLAEEQRNNLVGISFEPVCDVCRGLAPIADLFRVCVAPIGQDVIGELLPTVSENSHARSCASAS